MRTTIKDVGGPVMLTRPQDTRPGPGWQGQGQVQGFGLQGQDQGHVVQSQGQKFLP